VKARRVRLLTVTGPAHTTDLVVAADVPLAALQPVLVELVGGWHYDQDDPQWALYRADGTLLTPGVSLHGQGVLDGETLHLRARADRSSLPSTPLEPPDA